MLKKVSLHIWQISLIPQVVLLADTILTCSVEVIDEIIASDSKEHRRHRCCFVDGRSPVTQSQTAILAGRDGLQSKPSCSVLRTCQDVQTCLQKQLRPTTLSCYRPRQTCARSDLRPWHTIKILVSYRAYLGTSEQKSPSNSSNNANKVDTLAALSGATRMHSSKKCTAASWKRSNQTWLKRRTRCREWILPYQ